MLRFVLASASPARKAVLTAAGVRAEVIVSDVDEDAHIAAHAAERGDRDGPRRTARLVERLAEAKATAVAQRLDGRALVLGCDSMLDLDGRALGKPATVGEAMARWQQLRGRSGVLHTGHCLIDVATGQGIVAGAATTVHFADITDSEIALYCATGEPTQVAGAFTVDGLGGWFIRGVEGDHHNVIGLSLPLLRTMLADLGHSLTDLGYAAG